MLILGQYTEMRDLRRQLEQHVECRGLERELEQQPYEFEQQRRVSCRLQLHLKLQNGDSGAAGIYCPALRAKYFLILLFGRLLSRRPGGFN